MVIITRYINSIVELYKTTEDIFRYLKSKGGNLIFSDRRQSPYQLPEKGTILIAVYDPMKSNYLKISLERLGWKVFVTNDGITALKLYNRVKPLILVLDEEIPLINYKDIINVLRYELSDNRIAIVLLSEIDEWINSQYKFTALSKDLNAEKINQKFITLISQNYNNRG
jgi:PleD family two-component response regulator